MRTANGWPEARLLNGESSSLLAAEPAPLHRGLAWRAANIEQMARLSHIAGWWIGKGAQALAFLISSAISGTALKRSATSP